MIIWSTGNKFDQGSISPTFYEQLLHLQIPKVQKDNQLKQLFALSGSACVKAVHKHVDEIDPWQDFKDE